MFELLFIVCAPRVVVVWCFAWSCFFTWLTILGSGFTQIPFCLFFFLLCLQDPLENPLPQRSASVCFDPNLPSLSLKTTLLLGKLAFFQSFFMHPDLFSNLSLSSSSLVRGILLKACLSFLFGSKHFSSRRGRASWCPLGIGGIWLSSLVEFSQTSFIFTREFFGCADSDIVVTGTEIWVSCFSTEVGSPNNKSAHVLETWQFGWIYFNMWANMFLPGFHSRLQLHRSQKGEEVSKSWAELRIRVGSPMSIWISAQSHRRKMFPRNRVTNIYCLVSKQLRF